MKWFNYLLVVLIIGVVTSDKLSAQEYVPVVEVKTAPLKMILGGFGIGADFCLNDNISVEGILQYKDRQVIDRKVISLQGFGKYYLNSRKGADGFYFGPYLKMQHRTFGADIFSDSSTEKRLALGMISGYKLVSDAGVLIEFTAGFGNNLVSKWESSNSNVNASTINRNDTVGYDYILRLSLGYRFGTLNEHSNTGKLERKLKSDKINRNRISKVDRHQSRK